MQKGFHHVAFACRDPEATRHFYEDLLAPYKSYLKYKTLFTKPP